MAEKTSVNEMNIPFITTELIGDKLLGTLRHLSVNSKRFGSTLIETRFIATEDTLIFPDLLAIDQRQPLLLSEAIIDLHIHKKTITDEVHARLSERLIVQLGDVVYDREHREREIKKAESRKKNPPNPIPFTRISKNVIVRKPNPHTSEYIEVFTADDIK